MPSREPSYDQGMASQGVVRTTLLSLVDTLTHEGYDERAVCDRAVELIETHRVELIGTLRECGIRRSELEDG